jgi:hypothetical protein
LTATNFPRIIFVLEVGFDIKSSMFPLSSIAGMNDEVSIIKRTKTMKKGMCEIKEVSKLTIAAWNESFPVASIIELMASVVSRFRNPRKRSRNNEIITNIDRINFFANASRNVIMIMAFI